MSRWQTLKRVMLPACLAAFGVWLLTGCIYIPGRDKLPAEARDPRPSVGKRDSDRPLKIGVSSREDVYQVLGRADGGSRDGLTWEYHWEAQNGSWLVPLCFTAEPAWRRYVMRLEFDGNGRLKRYRVSYDVDSFNPLEAPRPIPEQPRK